MTRRLLCLAAFLVFGSLPPAVSAQTVTWSGQIRPRYEHRDPVAGGPDEFTSMRVRLGLLARVDSSLSVFVQGQDVRLWGEETNTLSDFRADNIDVHQAWLRYRHPGAPWLVSTVGRQEMSFGGQRLIGAVDWTQQGRAFDGVRLDLGQGRGRVSLVGMTLAENTAAAHEVDGALLGAYATIGAVGPGALDLYLLNDRVDATAQTDQLTMGARYAFQHSGFAGRVEGSLQRGDRVGTPVSASMVGARVGRSFSGDAVHLAVWYDRLSADDPNDPDTNAFSTLFATNHKFYGFADLFLDIPAHTQGRGLEDIAVKLSARLGSGTTAALDLHRFAAVSARDLASGHYADELDLTGTHRLSPHLSIVGGFSFVWQDDALARVGRLSEDLTFGYLSINATF